MEEASAGGGHVSGGGGRAGAACVDARHGNRLQLVSPTAPAADMATTAEASSHSSDALVCYHLALPDQAALARSATQYNLVFHDLDFLLC